VREIRLHGSEGGAVQANAPFLPLSVGLQTHMDLLRCGRQTPPWKAALPWGFNAYIGSSPLRVCALFSHFPKNDEKSPIDTPLRKAALPGGFNAYIGSSPLRVCALFSHFPKNDEKSLIDAPPWKTALPWYLKENKVTLRYPTFL